MLRKLSKDQILSIPELVKDKTVEEIATIFGVHRRSVDYQIKRLRSAGIKVETTRGPKPTKLV